MAKLGNSWAVVLAAGEGTRLRSLTTDPAGRAVPKQYCSLFGGATLLHDALKRAHAAVPRERICGIVAAHHQEWWQRALWALPVRNAIVQPGNRGTANGILLALLTILGRDPFARILFLPADHFVRDEAVLAAAMQSALAGLARAPRELALLGITPEEADPELGYILPAARLAGGAAAVDRFVEKPPLPEARTLLATGALWNSFIFAADGLSLLGLFRERLPHEVDAMETALARHVAEGQRSAALAELYGSLRDLDFSRDILAGAESRLSVVEVAPCGWSDLGTPRRIAEAVQRAGHGRVSHLRQRRQDPVSAPLNLAHAFARAQFAS